jgi:hypothetical protein
MGRPSHAAQACIRHIRQKQLLSASKLPLELGFGAFQRAPTARRQFFTRSIDIEHEHRQGRAIGGRFAPPAPLRRALERSRDAFGIASAEYALLEIERVAFAGDAAGPISRVLSRCGFAPFRSSRSGVSPGRGSGHFQPPEPSAQSENRVRRRNVPTRQGMRRQMSAGPFQARQRIDCVGIVYGDADHRIDRRLPRPPLERAHGVGVTGLPAIGDALR